MVVGEWFVVRWKKGIGNVRVEEVELVSVEVEVEYWRGD